MGELRNLLTDNTKGEDVVDKWIDDGKYFSSIAYQLKQVDVNSLSKPQLEVFVSGVLRFVQQLTNYTTHYSGTAKTILQERNIHKNKHNDIHDIVVSWFERHIPVEKDALSLSRILNNLYNSESYDENGTKEVDCPLVISNEEIENFLARIMDNYLNKHPETSVRELFDENSGLGRLFNNCSVNVENNVPLDGYKVYNQAAFDTVIRHFAKAVVKPTVNEFDKFFNKMYTEETPNFSSREEDDEYWSYQEERRDYSLNAYFGSTWGMKDGDKVEELKQKCFSDSTESQHAPNSKNLTKNRDNKKQKIRSRSKKSKIKKAK